MNRKGKEKVRERGRERETGRARWRWREIVKHLLTSQYLEIFHFSWNRINATEPQFCFQFSSVQSLSRVRLFATPWIAARQASLSITNSRSSLKLTSIELVMPFSCLILCRPLFLLSPIPPSIRVFSNESTLCISSLTTDQTGATCIVSAES